MGDKLNGAYYGPSIPPPKSSHRRRHHGGSGCCCGCCSCIFNCILGCICNLICSILTTILVIVAIAAFLFWLIVHPNVVKFHVTEASLTQFNYTGNTLHYDLALNITVRNPNRRLGIYYDYIEGRALYHDARFGSQNLDPFFQETKNTSVLNPVFKGQQVIPLGADQTDQLNKEKSDGVYEIEVKLYAKVRFKLGWFKIGKFKPKISCDFKVPLTSSANKTSPAGEFQATKCGWDY